MSRPRPRALPGRCPICGRARAETYRPFCSRRCADLDLARWLEGGYAIPGRESADDGTERPASRRDDDE